MHTYASNHYVVGDAPEGRIRLDGLATLNLAGEFSTAIQFNVVHASDGLAFREYLHALSAVAAELADRVRLFHVDQTDVDPSAIRPLMADLT